MWETIALLVIKEGLPVALSIAQKWMSGKDPTQADFDELRALSGQTAVDRVKKVLADNGIAEDSPQGKAILDAAKHPA